MREEINKYLYAEEQPKINNRKTKVWEIVSTKNNITLGIVIWHSPWRKFVFKPEFQTLFSIDCLEDIIKFIDQKQRLHKLSLIQEIEDKID